MATLGYAEDDKSSLEIQSWARLVSTHPGMANIDITKEEVFVGRREDADVVVRDAAVSNTHCKLWREEVRQEDQDSPFPFNVFLEDLSKNGTFIRDKKIGRGNKVRLTSGTEIALIPRGPRRKKLSFVLYIPAFEEQEEAPEGQVTFVFTDIQSSTTLWEKAPEAMNEALKKHDSILRRLMRKHRGYEVKTEGDAFMVAFFSVLDAVHWCIAVQKALLQAEWPQTLLAIPSACAETDKDGHRVFNGLRVRMGIHTGVPNCRRNPVTARMDYYGPVVNRAARVSDSANGGQILVTEEVKASFDVSVAKGETALPVVYSDLGKHPYKGVPTPLLVFQMSAPELATRVFPALRTEEVKQQQKIAEGQRTLGHKLLPEENPSLLASKNTLFAGTVPLSILESTPEEEALSAALKEVMTPKVDGYPQSSDLSP